MGYDVSYHPVDVELLHERVLPFILGQTTEDDIGDLVGTGMRIREIRWRAKAWALGARHRMGRYDPFLYVWGRPFFITSADADAVAEDVLRYLGMFGVAEVDDVARAMADALGPSDTPAAPNDPGHYPLDDERLRYEVVGALRVLRRAVAALRAGEERVPGLKTDRAPADLVAGNAAFDLIEFASMLTPGWMDRGPVWPTRLVEDVGLDWPPAFGSHEPLLAPLMAEFPDAKWDPAHTIEHNYMVGGLVAAADVPAARAWFAERRDRILAAEGIGVARDQFALTLTKIDEAMAMAARLEHAFCEATEIYSGIEGRPN
jgi:hypothetical protein